MAARMLFQTISARLRLLAHNNQLKNGAGAICSLPHFLFIMAKILIVISLQLVCNSVSSWGQKIYVSGIAGIKIHSNQNKLPEYPDAWQMLSSPLFGFKISHKKLPIDLIYTHDFTYAIYNEVGNNPAGISNVPQKSGGNLLLLQYNKNILLAGIGHYQRKHESFTLFVVPEANKTENLIVLSAGLHFRKLDIDYQRQIQYKPFFGVFDWGFQSINLRYHIGKHQKIVPKKLTKFMEIEIRTGGRLSPVKQTFLTGETSSLVKLSPNIGIDIYFDRINTSVLFDRDWWIAINGGSFQRDIKGYVSNSTIGLCYHIQTKKEKIIKVGAGVAYIIDHNSIYEARTKINQGLLKPNSWYYNVKGLYFSYYHPVTDNVELEFRQILPLINEKLFNPSRTSLGLAYKFKP